MRARLQDAEEKLTKVMRLLKSPHTLDAQSVIIELVDEALVEVVLTKEHLTKCFVAQIPQGDA